MFLQDFNSGREHDGERRPKRAPGKAQGREGGKTELMNITKLFTVSIFLLIIIPPSVPALSLLSNNKT